MSNVSGDVIDNLPTDPTAIPSHGEIQILDTLFKQKKGTVDRVLEHSRDVLIVGLIFVVFSLPQIDGVISKLIPSTENSPYMLMLVKALAVMLLYFILKNWYLARK
jgi:hypothetical protein